MKTKTLLTQNARKIIFVFFASILSTGLLKAQYTASPPISYSGKTGITIADKDFTSGSGSAAIYLSSCSDIKIVNCRFTNIPTYIAIQLNQCSNIEIVNCFFDTFMSGVYAVKCTGGINIHCNSFENIVGPKPRGQIVQFNTCTGGGNRINYNISDHKMSSTMDPEDLINVYASQGLSTDPIQIIGNNLRGGGPSTSGGGIMVGDNNGKHIIVQDNILVDPGQYGIGVPAGEDIIVKNNKVYAKQQSFTNVGIYVGLAGEIAAGYPCVGSSITVQGNQVNWTKSTGIKNGWYNCSCCPVGTLSGNNFNASIGSDILPLTLSLNSATCGTSTPPVNQAPAVSISVTSFTAPASISISANATDTDGTISKVDFYNGSTLIGTDATAPYGITWNVSTAGTYTLTVKATDNAQAVTTSSAVTVTVSSVTVANIAPKVSLTSPSGGQTFIAPASITISASASDADGTVSKVDFYNGSTLLYSDAIAPYSYSWNSVAAGSYSLKAIATDNAGATTSSSTITVTVSIVSGTTGISGPSCVNQNISSAFTLNPPTGFSSASWWTNADAVITTDPADSKKINVKYSQNVSGFVTLTCGVNLSVSPYYKEYSKTIQIGGCAARFAATVDYSNELITSPNPFIEQISLSMKNGERIFNIKISDINGKECLNTGNIETEQISLGEELKPGVYILNILTQSGIQVRKLVKAE